MSISEIPPILACNAGVEIADALRMRQRDLTKLPSLGSLSNSKSNKFPAADIERQNSSPLARAPSAVRADLLNCSANINDTRWAHVGWPNVQISSALGLSALEVSG